MGERKLERTKDGAQVGKKPFEGTSRKRKEGGKKQKMGDDGN